MDSRLNLCIDNCDAIDIYTYYIADNTVRYVSILDESAGHVLMTVEDNHAVEQVHCSDHIGDVDYFVYHAKPTLSFNVSNRCVNGYDSRIVTYEVSDKDYRVLKARESKERTIFEHHAASGFMQTLF